MLSVSQLARRCRLSRTAVLYYERCGLLKPALRTAADYRLYGEREAKLLEQICLYRSIGVSVRDIARVLAAPQTKPTAVLKRRLRELSGPCVPDFPMLSHPKPRSIRAPGDPSIHVHPASQLVQQLAERHVKNGDGFTHGRYGNASAVRTIG